MASKQEEFAGKEQNTVAALNKAYEERNRKIDEKNKELAKITRDVFSSGGGTGGRGTVTTIAEQKAAIERKYAPQLAEIDKTINQVKLKNLELNKSNENKFSYKASIRGSNNDSIFRRTLIDCSKNDFDFAIIAWSHPERTLAQNQYALLDLNYEKLKKESQKKFLELKEEYQKLVEEYKWNDLVYNAKFSFEPVIGQIYHLYLRPNGEIFLSLITPDEWNKESLGSFRLSSEQKWIKL